ncbi:MAG TPA: hypothetical protein VKG26_10410 [Bacteroidia bacterium]|nr:hypothetical protein [Bacteroidia bacterium]
MKSKLIILLLISFLYKVNAQNSNVVISDVILHTIKKPFRSTGTASDAPVPDTINARLMFSCTPPSNTDTLVVKIGSDKNDGTFFYEKFPVVSKPNNVFGFVGSGTYYLQNKTTSSDNVFNRFTGGNMIGFNMTFPESMLQKIKWITVYAIDKQNNVSNYQYYQAN